MCNDWTAYFQFQREIEKLLKFVSVSVAKLKYVSFCWGMERVIHQVPILSPTGKQAGTACPVPYYCKEQLLSKPQRHLAGIWSELAHHG